MSEIIAHVKLFFHCLVRFHRQAEHWTSARHAIYCYDCGKIFYDEMWPEVKP